MRGGDAVLVDDELVRGETPDFLLVVGVAEFEEGLVAFGGEAYDYEVGGVVVVGGIGGVGGAYDFDELVLERTDDCDGGGVVRATDESGGVGHDAGMCEYELRTEGGGMVTYMMRFTVQFLYGL